MSCWISKEEKDAVLQNSSADDSCARQKASSPFTSDGCRNSLQIHTAYSTSGGLAWINTQVMAGIKSSADRVWWWRLSFGLSCPAASNAMSFTSMASLEDAGVDINNVVSIRRLESCSHTILYSSDAREEVLTGVGMEIICVSAASFEGYLSSEELSSVSCGNKCMLSHPQQE